MFDAQNRLLFQIPLTFATKMFKYRTTKKRTLLPCCPTAKAKEIRAESLEREFVNTPTNKKR